MIVLALDTTTRAGSIAVLGEGRAPTEYVGDPSRTHGERLPADLMHALARAGVAPRELTLLAVAAGPGSFTGLRVGIASMQGLAVALDLRIVPVSTLDALARLGAGGHGRVAAWVDAQRGEIFGALYEPDGRTVVRPASSLTPEATLDAWTADLTSGPVPFVGDGAVRYTAAIRARLGDENRSLRIYGSEIVICRLTGDGKRARLHLLNYGGRQVDSVRLRLHGNFDKAEATAYGFGRVDLEEIVNDETATEFSITKMGMYAVVDLSATK